VADTMVKLYRYCNETYRDVPGGQPCDYTLRLVEVVDAKETPTAYTYRRDGAQKVLYSRSYEMVSKSDIGRVPYSGLGDIWMLREDAEEVRRLLLERLRERRTRGIGESEREMGVCNKAIVALGGYTEWPDYLREEAGG